MKIVVLVPFNSENNAFSDFNSEHSALISENSVLIQCFWPPQKCFGREIGFLMADFDIVKSASFLFSSSIRFWGSRREFVIF